jgi:hypothetical protein
MSEATAVPTQRAWIEVDRTVRRAELRKIFVDRPVTEHLTGLLDKVRRERDAMTEPSNIMLMGDTGTGKSSFLRKYAARSPSRRTRGNLIQPVVMTEFLPGTKLNGAAKILLIALGDPSRGSGILTDLALRATDQIIKQKVEMVLLDEFQHLIETGEKSINKAGDFVKQVSKATNVPFVMTGMPSALGILKVNSQLAGITPHLKEMGRFSWATSEDRLILRRFLARVDDALPFDDPAGLGDPETAERIFEATKGMMRATMTLIKQAAIHSLDRGGEQILAEDLRYGYEQTPGVNHDANPF